MSTSPKSLLECWIVLGRQQMQLEALLLSLTAPETLLEHDVISLICAIEKMLRSADQEAMISLIERAAGFLTSASRLRRWLN